MGQYGNQPDFGTKGIAITPKGFASGDYVAVEYNNGGEEPVKVYLTSKNLNVSTFNDGTPIVQAFSYGDWENYQDNDVPCWAYYGYTETDTLGLGKIYNNWAAQNTNLYPTGYSCLGIDVAINFNDYNNGISSKLKSIPIAKEGQDPTGTLLWTFYDSSIVNTNIFGFTGFPGGYIGGGDYNGININTKFWTNDYQNALVLNYISNDVFLEKKYGNGYYIRMQLNPNEIVKPESLNSAALYVGTGGDLVVTIVGSETPVMFKNVPDASFLPIIVSNVWEQGDMGITTASDIIALY